MAGLGWRGQDKKGGGGSMGVMMSLVGTGINWLLALGFGTPRVQDLSSLIAAPSVFAGMVVF